MVRNADYRDQELQLSAEGKLSSREIEKQHRAVLEGYRDYQLIDCDQHYYEPDDCFTRHLESKYLDVAVEVRRDQADGLGRIYRAGQRFRHLSGPLGERTQAPGALREYFKSDGAEKASASANIRAEDFPEFIDDKAARLKVMDAHDVQATLMLPTLGVVVESECCATRDTSPEAWFALMRSFNRWVEEAWGFGADGRIFGAPLVSLYDPALAVVELERLIAAGARAVVLRAGPAYGYSPADEIFDPFWARVQEAGVVVAFHTGDFGYQDFFATEWGYGKEHKPFGSASAFERLTCGSERAISDTIAALIFGNLFGRFPELRFAVIELGSVWLRPLLKNLDHAWSRGTKDRARIADRPSDVYKKHFWISPYYEDPFDEVIEMVGADRVLLGSDWPHPEGVPEPLDMLEEMGLLSSEELRLIARDNTATLLGLS